MFTDINIYPINDKDHILEKYFFLEKIKQKFPNAPEIPADTLNNKIDEFTNCEHDQVFRGKYEMWFLLIFLRLILIDSNKSKLFISEKLTFAFNNDHSSPSPSLVMNKHLKYLVTMLKPLKV